MRANPFLLIITAVFFILNLSSCTIVRKIGEYKDRQIEEEYQENLTEIKLRQAWRERYVSDILYVDMPEDEFVRLFTKTSDWIESERPYITKQKKRGKRNYYILSGLESSYDYRSTFENGNLVKFEYHGHGGGGNPFGYNDNTSSLKGFKVDGPGFYDFMSEDEFIKTFSDSILSHSENRYVVIGKNGRKYRVEFHKGHLIGVESL